MAELDSEQPEDIVQPSPVLRKQLVMAKYAIVSAWIPKEARVQLEAVAKANNVTMSRYIGAIIVDALAEEAEKVAKPLVVLPSE